MAGVTTYSCTKCRPVDTEIIEAYLVLTNTSKAVSQQEAGRVAAENARVLAEQGRAQQFAEDHGVAQEDHRIASGDHTLAVADHGTASDDHVLAVADHGTASDDHTASTSATTRANNAAAAAEHMVDIHQGPPGPAGKAPVVGANGNWWTWDDETEAYVDSGEKAQGEVGPTPDFSIGTVTTGEAGSQASASITGTAAAPVLNLTIPKGDQGIQGNTGSSVAYPFELVNNLTTNDATKGLSAAQGKVLKDELTQLEAKVGDLYDLQTQDKTSIVDAINELASAGGFPISAAALLVSILRRAVYTTDDVGTDIDDLEDLIVVSNVASISAVFTPGTEVFYYGEYLDVLRPFLVVTANYDDNTSEVVQDYTITGEINSATNTITIHYRGKTDTISVNATEPIHFRGEGSFVKRLQAITAYTSTTKNPAQIDGVFYYFTRVSYTGDTKPDKRCSYYLFDLDLTPSKKYEFLLLVEDDQEYTMQMGLQYYDSTLKSIGQANNDPGESVNYDSHATDPGWKTLTKVGRFYRYEYTTPSNRVGIRLTLRIGTNDNTEWPLTTQTIKELIINEVNNG